MENLKKYMAELLGTAILAGVVTLCVVFNAGTLTALAIGLTLMMLVYIIGPISGSHVNPAVSFGFALRGKLSWKDFLFYVVAQVAGAVLGVLLVFTVFKIATDGGDFNTVNKLVATEKLPFKAFFTMFVVDIALTFVFVLAIMGIVRKNENKSIAGLAIGFTLAALVIAGSVYASLNPAVAFGTAFFSCFANGWALANIWIFVASSLVGGALAAFVAMYLFKDEEGEKSAPVVKQPTQPRPVTAAQK